MKRPYKAVIFKNKSLITSENCFLTDNFIGISIGTGGVKLVFDLFAATLFAIGILSHKSDDADRNMLPLNNDDKLPNFDGPNDPDPGGDKDSKKSDLKICNDVVRQIRDSESEKYERILGQPRHQLDKIGKSPDEIIEKTLNLVQKAIDDKIIKNSGEYKIRGIIDGYELEVRGAVVGSTVKIGTFFVDKNCC